MTLTGQFCLQRPLRRFFGGYKPGSMPDRPGRANIRVPDDLLRATSSGNPDAIHMNEGSLSLHRKRLGVQCQGEVEGPPDVPSTKELKEAAGVCADAVSYGT